MPTDRSSAVSQVARYSIAGVGSAAADFGLFALLTHSFALDPLLAHAVSRPVGGLVCWLLNRRFTFRSRAPVAGELRRFALVWCVSFALTEGLLALFCHALHWAELPGKLAAEAIALCFNFLALKHFTYRSGTRS